MTELSQDASALVTELCAAGGTAALCQHCHTALDTVSGVGLTVFTGSAGRFVVGTDGILIDQIEDLQISLNQGPCLEAVRTCRPVLVDDLAAASATVRWPAFTVQARRHGVAAVFAFPVLVGGTALAVLDLYRTTAGPLPKDDHQQAAAYATAAAVLLTDDARARATAQDGASVPAGAARTQQALGMVMAQDGSDAAAALHRLRRHAADHNQSLAHIVDEILTGRLRLDPATGL
ncbi:GAF and ANTAR domain-containing protein [Actinoplanes sp. NPDC023936]|uniref:GAF and ANTAR domain-containing protein n=1 Tax=Actinoplanes sp. NPDC023936 TaxID=3154910 RepID=UPI0033F32BB7